MKIKNNLIIVIALFLLSIFVMIYIYSQVEDPSLDILEINDIRLTIEESWDNLDLDNPPDFNYDLDYVVLDVDDNLILGSKENLNTDLHNAMRNHDTIIYLTEDNLIYGKIIIYNNDLDIINSYKLDLLISHLILLFIIFAFIVSYLLYINNNIFKPFKTLQSFSHQVAQGNLDIPLEMDKSNYFGSFTESFDIMRIELKKARENELLANQSKKELVMSLSHDIKTPIASIKAVCELMLEKETDKYLSDQFNIISLKAEQINSLITNIFNATLEELQELRVSVEEASSEVITKIIENSDYNHLCRVEDIEGCLVFIDHLRLEQVIDNIISNSYKYANTEIIISSKIIDGYLEIEFKDFGPGVDDNDLLLLANKYYRSSNATGISGSGLGLYISKFLMNKMMGDISFVNHNDSFSVILKVLLI